MAKRDKADVIDKVMAEPIQMPGCPQLVVTRAFAWQWLKRMGYNPDPRAGYASIDYMVFGGSRMKPCDEPLTDMSLPWVKNVLALMESHCAAA